MFKCTTFGNGKTRNARGRNGFSVVEVAMWSVFVVGAIALVFNYFQGAKDAREFARAQQNISTIVENIQTLYKGQDDFSTVTTAIAVKAGAVPKEWVNASYTIKSPWGSVSVDPGTGNNTFEILVNNVPQEGCITIAQNMINAEQLNTVTIGTTVLDNAATPASIATACADEDDNDMTFKAGR